MNQSTHNWVTGATSILSLIGVVFLFFQLQQTKEQLSINAVQQWNNSNKPYSKSCVECFTLLDEEQALGILDKKEIKLTTKQKKAIESLNRCLYTSNIDNVLFDNEDLKITIIGSTYVSGEITRTMNEFNNVIKAKYSNAYDPKIIDEEFRDIVASCFFRTALSRIAKHHQQRNALRELKLYVEELRQNYNQFPKDCN